MNSKDHVLSGEQALDDYFTALLDEELDIVEETYTPAVAEVNVGSSPIPIIDPEPKLQPDNQTSYNDLEYNEFEVPDLEDVQKLLDKLEKTDLAAEPEIVTIIEKNNGEIVKSEPVAEEVQEWAVETTKESVEEIITTEPEIVEHEEVAQQAEAELETQTGRAEVPDWQSIARTDAFQVLYFDVNGITFAVPLDELGGIHRRGEMNHLIGRPGWYLGLQTNKEDQLDVVDTAKWVMSDRLSDDSHREDYQYIVMLGASNRT